MNFNTLANNPITQNPININNNLNDSSSKKKIYEKLYYKIEKYEKFFKNTDILFEEIKSSVLGQTLVPEVVGLGEQEFDNQKNEIVLIQNTINHIKQYILTPNKNQEEIKKQLTFIDNVTKNYQQIINRTIENITFSEIQSLQNKIESSPTNQNMVNRYKIKTENSLTSAKKSIKDLENFYGKDFYKHLSEVKKEFNEIFNEFTNIINKELQLPELITQEGPFINIQSTSSENNNINNSDALKYGRAIILFPFVVYILYYFLKKNNKKDDDLINTYDLKDSSLTLIA